MFNMWRIMMTKQDNSLLEQILNIGIALSVEKDSDKLFDKIIDTAMDLTGSDGGTLYTVEEDGLHFRIMKTRSKGVDLGGDGETINIPPVKLVSENICAYAAINKKALNIADVYESELFDFSGPKKYDEANDYHTRSMVAIPMIDYADNVIGVMQLINATDDAGELRSYSEEEEHILLSLASQTAIALANMTYVDEIRRQLWSFTEALTEAIDARTPYNASHTRQVAKYAGYIVDHINELHLDGKEELFFSEEHRDEIVMAALLHDIGKMIVPIRVMNKQTRLGDHEETIRQRLDRIALLSKIDLLESRISIEDKMSVDDKIAYTLDVMGRANSAGFINDELMAEVDTVCDYTYDSPEAGETVSFLSDEEKGFLHIRKGTLTDEERRIMESHVEMTDRILGKVYFNKSYERAPRWAAMHHECIDGSGYPLGISEASVDTEARILAVADICDALLATDRPYKKPLPMDKAFSIMRSMADEGKLETRFVEYLETVLREQ